MAYITEDDLLKYAYNEASPEKTLEILRLLPIDHDIQERLNRIKTVQIRLEKINLLSPDTRTLDNIFSYSEKKQEEFQVFK